ncbi:cytochrome P450 monooxygenase 2 [Microdochium nivale]|nr:cytochrome P450 monooxygenase 2 [Microdochium nivale]
MAAYSSSFPSPEDVAPALTAAIQSNPQAAAAVTALLLGLGGSLLWKQSVSSTKSAGFPMLDSTPKEFLDNAYQVLERGRALFKDKPFTIATNEGYYTVLSPELGNALRSEPTLNFFHTAAENMQSHIPGFEPFAAGNQSEALLQIVTRKQLTKSLSRITGILSLEASFAVGLNFGLSSATAWQTISPFPACLDVVARLSSRIFLGVELSRNQEWLDITKSYTVNAFHASILLRTYPLWSRRFAASWLVPEVRIVRHQMAEATKLVDGIIAKRRQEDKEGTAINERVPDAIDWFEEESGGAPYDSGLMQLTLAAVAIHTTTDLLTETMLRLAQEPELVEELRAEIKSVLLADGAWTKAGMANLKLLDSAIKEAQRLRPILSANMLRRVMAPTPVPGHEGRVFPKGSQLIVSTHYRHDPNTYPEPLKYNGRRFADMRADPNLDKKLPVHLVSTGPTSLSFGHGVHSCPGRFFAANEVKVALCHMLVKYDWAMENPGEDISPFMSGFSLNVNTTAKLRFRKRTPEEMDFDIDAICTDKE